ncbi:MAG: amino acid permease, partial [Spirochaetaceae bacterium]
MKKLGTFGGVFVPSFEAILGAVLFLILPLLVGAVGVWNVMIIVVLANSATLATAFSIADSSTNVRNVGAGGMYALSKNSLGIAFGGSIGIQLFIAQAVSIGFYSVGFAEPLQQFVVRIPAIA